MTKMCLFIKTHMHQPVGACLSMGHFRKMHRKLVIVDTWGCRDRVGEGGAGSLAEQKPTLYYKPLCTVCIFKTRHMYYFLTEK